MSETAGGGETVPEFVPEVMSFWCELYSAEWNETLVELNRMVSSGCAKERMLPHLSTALSGLVTSSFGKAQFYPDPDMIERLVEFLCREDVWDGEGPKSPQQFWLAVQSGSILLSRVFDTLWQRLPPVEYRHRPFRHYGSIRESFWRQVVMGEAPEQHATSVPWHYVLLPIRTLIQGESYAEPGKPYWRLALALDLLLKHRFGSGFLPDSAFGAQLFKEPVSGPHREEWNAWLEQQGLEPVAETKQVWQKDLVPGDPRRVAVPNRERAFLRFAVEIGAANYTCWEEAHKALLAGTFDAVDVFAKVRDYITPDQRAAQFLEALGIPLGRELEPHAGVGIAAKSDADHLDTPAPAYSGVTGRKQAVRDTVEALIMSGTESEFGWIESWCDKPDFAALLKFIRSYLPDQFRRLQYKTFINSADRKWRKNFVNDVQRWANKRRLKHGTGSKPGLNRD